MGKIDLVMPVIARDLDRFRIFFRSWEQYWRVPGRLLLCVPDADLAVFAPFAQRGGGAVEVVPKRHIIGDVPYTRGTKGWYRQQMVKLGAARFVDSDFYCAIDADCFVARHLAFDDLIRDGRAPVDPLVVEPPGYHIRYVTAAAAMDLEPQVLSRRYTLTPPFFFSRALVEGALVRMEQKGMEWPLVLDMTPEWTECSVYYIYACAVDQWAAHHYECPDLVHSPLWAFSEDHEGDFVRWDPAATFGRAAFGVVQSFGGISVDRILPRIEPFLPLS